jgi:hypothetical protein
MSHGNCVYSRGLTCNWILWTLEQLVTKIYQSLSHTGQCSQSCTSLCCLVTVYGGGRTPSSGFPNSGTAAATPNWLFACRLSLDSSLNSWLSLYMDWLIIPVQVTLRPTVSRPVCLDVGISSGAHDQISFISLTIAGFLIWGTLSDERMGPQFTCTPASEPCQSSDSWVEVPQNSRPYFTVSFQTPNL